MPASVMSTLPWSVPRKFGNHSTAASTRLTAKMNAGSTLGRFVMVLAVCFLGLRRHDSNGFERALRDTVARARAGGNRGGVGGLAARDPTVRPGLDRERLGLQLRADSVLQQQQRLGAELRDTRLTDPELVGKILHRPLLEEVADHD